MSAAHYRFDRNDASMWILNAQLTHNEAFNLDSKSDRSMYAIDACAKIPTEIESPFAPDLDRERMLTYELRQIVAATLERKEIRNLRLL